MIQLNAKSWIIAHDEKLDVHRDNGDVTWVDGKPVKGPGIDFQIICNVQPMNAKDLLILPEGDRHKEQYFVWIQNFDEQRLITNDRVKFRNIYYQTQSTEQWGEYTKARIMKVDVGPDAQGQS